MMNSTDFFFLAKEAGLEKLDSLIYRRHFKKCRDILNKRNEEGKTCLHVAVKHHRGLTASQLIRRLSKLGADVNAQESSTDNTVLHIAILQEDLELVELLHLLPQKMDYSIKNKDELTPVELAKKRGNKYIIAALKHSYMLNSKYFHDGLLV
ncbi:hypothetical protein O0L34_g1816 [Tuta absoluta]|nr:hypothetical protein O0L34_g1815 [Tuta absoluta]KAJ2944921.1 hypothetical protein O0L34_g1816 [Tuta absoluta]